jgi:hypothetical protein
MPYPDLDELQEQQDMTLSASDKRQLVFVNTEPMAETAQNSAKFAPRDVDLANWLASSIAMDALELGCTHVTIKKCGGWKLVSAEANWVNRGAGAGLAIEAAFRSLLPLLSQEKRTSSSPTRHEGWLKVYAQDVMVIDGQLAYRIKGNDLPEECHAFATSQPFCVAFRVSAEPSIST